jgi:hypothetical protein
MMERIEVMTAQVCIVFFLKIYLYLLYLFSFSKHDTPSTNDAMKRHPRSTGRRVDDIAQTTRIVVWANGKFFFRFYKLIYLSLFLFSFYKHDTPSTKSQRSVAQAREDPRDCVASQRRPMAASTGQRRSTKAHASQ